MSSIGGQRSRIARANFSPSIEPGMSMSVKTMQTSRAAGAKGGIYGNDAVEATYPMTRNDVDGQPLDGSKANYTVTFAKGAIAAGERVLVSNDV